MLVVRLTGLALDCLCWTGPVRFVLAGKDGWLRREEWSGWARGDAVPAVSGNLLEDLFGHSDRLECLVTGNVWLVASADAEDEIVLLVEDRVSTFYFEFF